jgi:hypothetical protein
MALEDDLTLRLRAVTMVVVVAADMLEMAAGLSHRTAPIVLVAAVVAQKVQALI